MKALIKLKLNIETEIDLSDYGIDENIRFEDLSEEQQNEITDPIRDQAIPDISVETID